MIGTALSIRENNSVQHRWFWLFAAVLAFCQLGCRQRAVTELYVEQMAQRNRALEDLVYDFDAENRAMEFELEDLRRTNAQLQGRLQELQRQSARTERSPSDTIRRESDRPEAKNKATTPAPLKLPSGRSKAESDLGTQQEPLKLDPPEIVVPKKSTEPTAVPQAEPLLPTPEPLNKESLLPKEPSSELLPQSKEQLLPPAAKESILKPAPSGLPTVPADASNSQRKIKLPSSGPSSQQSSVVQSSATQIKTKPVDPRVRQIDWHPTMCRAQNLDGKPGDDGLYLVLVPRNSAGEFVPTTGDLTIVVEETQSENSALRIGRYEFTAEELKEHLEPIGSAPGLHLPIRWTDQTPSSTSVEVYVKFTLSDGTTMVNRRTFPLRKLAASGPSNWTPR